MYDQLTFDEFPLFDDFLSNENSLLLVSHNEQSTYSSMAINMDDLAQQLLHECLKTRTAAYHLSSDFALAIHDHDIYTSAIYQNDTYEYEANLVKPLLMKDLTHQTPQVAMTFKRARSTMSDNDKAEINRLILENLPKIGELKFLAQYQGKMSYPIYDITNPKFIGWVPANGASYSLANFTLSEKLKNTFQNDGTTFIVPSLDKICKASIHNSPYNVQPGNTVLLEHSHSLNFDSNTVQTLTFNSTNFDPKSVAIPTYDNNSHCDYWLNIPSLSMDNPDPTAGYDTWQLHGGADFKVNEDGTVVYDTPVDHALTSIINVVNDDAVLGNLNIVSEDGSTISESYCSYPSHNIVPVMVFVGPSIYSKLYEHAITRH